MTEVVLASGMVGVVIAGAVAAATAAHRSWGQARAMRDAGRMADALLAEVLAAPYEASENANPADDFADVELDGVFVRIRLGAPAAPSLQTMEDFRGYSDTPTRWSGQPWPGATGYTRRVEIQALPAADGLSHHARTITVAVEGPHGVVVRRSAIAARAGRAARIGGEPAAGVVLVELAARDTRDAQEAVAVLELVNCPDPTEADD